MFFIVNAIDLANNEEELTQVLDYLSDQLLQFGIRNANLFPVSSLHALKEKQTGEELGSRFNDFEDAFYHFITGDLRKIALSTSEMEWTHARERIQHLVESAAKDRSEKAAQRKQLERERGKINDILATNALPVLNERLRQEIHELIYYIEQRVGYRFNDFLQNPLILLRLKEVGVNQNKHFTKLVNELIRLIGFDLAQELRHFIAN